MALSAVAEQATLETPPEPIIERQPSIIHGLENIIVPHEAVGAAPDQPAPTETVEGEQVPGQPEAKPDEALTLEDRVNADDELQKYLAEREQKAAARAVTAARQKWDSDVLRTKLQADRKQQEEALVELALKADAGDADALALLGKHVVAQVTKKTSAAEVYQQLFQEADATTQAVAGANPEMAAKLDLRNFGSLQEWAIALADARVTDAKANFQKELDKLSEAKAADLVAARRQALPSPDLTQPVAAGGTPRLWKSLAEAAELYASDSIPADQYAQAKQWFEEGRIPAGAYGD